MSPPQIASPANRPSPSISPPASQIVPADSTAQRYSISRSAMPAGQIVSLARAPRIHVLLAILKIIYRLRVFIC